MIKQAMPTVPGWQMVQSGFQSTSGWLASYQTELEEATQQRSVLLDESRRLAAQVPTKIITASDAKMALRHVHQNHGLAHVLPGKNLTYPAVGVVSLPNPLQLDTAFQRQHVQDGVINFDRKLSHKKRLKVIEDITGARIFGPLTDGADYRDNILAELSDQDILKILAFFGEEAVTKEGREYLIRMAKLGWSSEFLCDAAGQPLDIAYDLDDTRLHSWHPASLSAKHLAGVIHHFGFQDVLSRGLNYFWPDRFKETWGSYQTTTQMKPHAFFIFRMLRHDQLMRVETDGDRFTQYDHLVNFPNYRAALLGLLPYQYPDKERILANTKNVGTTRDHARNIEALAKHVYDRAVRDPLLAGLPSWDSLRQTLDDRRKHGLFSKIAEHVRRQFSSNGYLQGEASVFDSLSEEMKITVARLLFGDLDGLKPFKAKDSLLRKVNGTLPDGSDVPVARVDNGMKHGLAGLMTGTQSFVQIEDRHSNPVLFYSSTLFCNIAQRTTQYAARFVEQLVPRSLKPLIQAMSQDMIAWFDSKGALNQLPARGYSDEPMLQALQAVTSKEGAHHVNITDQSQGISGVIVQRQQNSSRSFDEFRRGFELNFKQAKAAIELLRTVFTYIGELDSVRRYYGGLRVPSK